MSETIPTAKFVGPYPPVFLHSAHADRVPDFRFAAEDRFQTKKRNPTVTLYIVSVPDHIQTEDADNCRGVAVRAKWHFKFGKGHFNYLFDNVEDAVLFKLKHVGGFERAEGGR